MRLQGISKMGYYPCPPQTLALIKQLLTTKNKHSKIRLLDPCCGEGEALISIANDLIDYPKAATVDSVGVELSPQRAAKAEWAGGIDTVLTGDWQEVTISNLSCSLLFLNPPYDTEVGNTGDGKRRTRLEYLFLRNTIRTLQHGGLLIYIVPEHILTDPKAARYLTSNFENISVARLPDDEYEVFKQIILFANKKAKAEPDAEAMEQMVLNANTGGFRALDGMVNASLIPLYEIPRMNVTEDKFILRKSSLSTAEIIDKMSRFKNALDGGPWADIQPKYSTAEFHPVVPLRTGHVGSLIASGQMRTVDLGDMVAKGRAIKETIAYDKDGRQVPLDDYYAVVMKEIFNTTITTLNEDGNKQVISKVMDLQRFLEVYAQDIASIIEQHFSPLYDKPTDQEWLALQHLMKTKKLPGRSEAGLLPVQKHVAIAASRCARKHGWADIIGEMGVGKTCISLSALDLMNEYPAIVLCPSHLVKKWAQEAKLVSGAEARIVENIADLMQFQEDYENGWLGEKAIAIVSKERAKLGSGWRPISTTKLATIMVEIEVPFPDDAMLPPVKKKVAQRVRIPACPKCGRHQLKKDETPLMSLSNKKRRFCNRGTAKWIGDPDDKTAGEFKHVVCGEPLYTFGAKYMRWPVAKYIRNKMPHFFKTLLADEFHQYKGKSSDQAQAYHDLVMATDYQLNLTGTIFGGKSTDLFWLRYRVDREVRFDYEFNDEHRWAKDYGRLQYALANNEDEDGNFTGKRRVANSVKEIPGISPSVFSRLLKTCIFVRITDLGITLPEYDEEIISIPMADNQAEQCEWLHDHLLDRIRTLKKARVSREASKILSVWLQNSLGRPNSCFRNEMVMWKGDEQKSPDGEAIRTPYAVKQFPVPEKFEQYQNQWELPDPYEDEQPLDQDAADQEFRQEYKMWASYMNAVPAMYGSKMPMALPRVIDEDMLLPKERWLIDTVLKERDQGRKTILYVRQTGTRNIQPRLERILRRYGLRAVTLPNGVKPASREAWIAKRTEDIDVLITNPRKVETGLDLINFHTCIFFEIEYSLFTLWQAMRRVWRLGQTKPVKVLFPLYAGTIEEQAMQLIAQKMKASLLLYGDNASSAVADESDDPAGDFLTELANMVLEDKNVELSDGFNGIMKEAVPVADTNNPLWREHQVEADPAHEILETEITTVEEPQLITHELFDAVVTAAQKDKGDK